MSMEKKPKHVQVNCGQAIILNKALGELEIFDGGMINTGSLMVSQEAYQSLLAKGFSINAGSTNILEIKGKALLFETGEMLLNAKEEDIRDSFLLVKGDLILPSTKTINFAQIEGLYVGGTLYYPETFALSAITGLKAQKTQQYPREGIFMKDKNVDLTEEEFLKLEKGGTYIVRDTLEITDPSLGQLQNNRGICFITRRLVIKEEYTSLFEKVDAQKRTLIPRGHELAKGDVALTPAACALYGDKVYVKGDLLVQPKGIKCLDNFTSIVVEGEANLTIEAVALFKKIGKAAKIRPFEGELKKINGETTYSHDALEGMKQTGGVYTLWVNGSLSFDESVAATDLEAFASIACNGVVAAPPAIMGAVQQKIDSLNGTLVPYEKGDAGKHKTLAETITGNEGAMINTGELIIV